MISKKYFFILLYFFIINQLSAQQYNSWINFNQEYYKVAVSENGIYHITYADLQQAGFPVSTINPQNLQLFHKGNERAIYVSGEDDGVFNNSDYIEFYGTLNDGSLDATMYDDPLNHNNPHASLYTNQTFYFLTYTLDNTKGKRVSDYDGTTGSGTTVQYHLEKALKYFSFDHTETNNLERYFSSGPLYPTYFQSISNQGGLLSGFTDDGKGYTDVYAGGTTYKEFSLDIENYTASGFQPTLSVKMSGRSNTQHKVSILAGQTSGALNSLSDLSFTYYENAELNTTLAFTDISASIDSFIVAYQIQPFSQSINEIVSLSGITLTYPQALDMGSKTSKIFNIPQSNDVLRKVTIANVSSDMRVFNISDPDNIKEVNGTLSGTNFTANIQGNNSEVILYISPETKSIDDVSEATIQPLTYTNANYVILTHRDLMQAAGDEDNVITAYADYRASAEGGNYTVLTAEINNIYNQFTYGEVHPVAIQRFIDALHQNTNPEFLFIIGKGLSFNYNYEKNKPSSESWTYKSLIPCYGEPCSDNLYSAGMEGTFLEPSVATGRLPASTPQHVLNYLNKIKEHEAFENDALWKKNFLHLSGGRTVSEHQNLSSHVISLADYITDEYMGAEVLFKAKETTNTTEFIDISDEVNDGLGMMTFFGHSSLTLVDLEFGYVSNSMRGFENQGKYPFILMMGCSVGDIFTSTRSIGEDWILTANKGAIGFLGHSYLAFVDTQKRYSNEFYETFFSDPENIGKPIGKVVQEAVKTYIENNSQNQRDWSNAEQFILSADPAVKIFNFDKPDYYIGTESLYTESFDITESIDSETDSFKIAMVVSNFGIVNKDTFEISVTRTFPDGSTREYTNKEYPTTIYQDTLYFTIPVTEDEKLKSGGNNQFEVMVDAGLQFDEMDELNNTAILDLYLKPRRMVIISPTEFSIVNQQPVKLFAQNTEDDTSEQTYIFQLDTTSYFNSPQLRDTTVTAGLTPHWETNLISDNATDSLVYYWRVRPTKNTEESDWTNSSFVYIKDSPNGWSQSHAQQFTSDNSENLEVNPENGIWSFLEKNINLRVQAVGGSAGDPLDYYIYMNDFRVAALGICDKNVIITLAINQHTGEPYTIPIFPHLKCGFGDKGEAFRLLDTDLRASNAMSIYMDYINEGDYVLLVSAGTVNFSNFSAANYAGFAEIGVDVSNLLNTLTSGDPYIAFGRKGDPVGSAQEVFPRYTALQPSNQQTITAEFEFDLSTSSGTITSTRIGPAKKWASLYQIASEKDQADEEANVDIIGVKIRGEESVLLSGIEDIHTDLTFINADTFPYLRLQQNITDTIGKTPVQLKDWKVLYDEVPEGILFKNLNSGARQTSIAEGDTMRYQYTFRNVSNTAFNDSLIVSYDLLNQTTNQNITRYDTLSSLAVNDSINFTLKIPTKDQAGTNRLNVFVNPRILAEQVYENNVQEDNFTVSPDTINPVLDVLFDGIRILDGDIISPTPLISINLKDENPFLIKTDTTGLEVFLSECDSCSFKKISLNSSSISWTSDENNLFQLFYQPDQLSDGIYTLLVQGTDDSENLSAIDPYQVSFEVINESRISNFYPYPNPFSDNVRFVFTLTGGEIPSGIKIQIMTVTGRVVREITQDELGTIRIGNNITEYAWDGRDEFGDQLANGVYLYRVMLQTSGDPFEKIETSADHMFKNGYGKMYLMR
ncbi:C25 family cysteine peptidase [Chondrinema litorale]|uniref:putative type IX secretion system sortase PorU2 n=1 Tax=Chondrinema litorale TaxID=2994555 RepID=UPI002542EB3A|nr:C25 family cysteine peptidase [Chondrinema litorale]UZR93318.1 C25 family cysteine peptidase [Chondrinema litorale]